MTEIDTPSKSTSGTARWGIRLAIAVITFAAFASGLSGEFVNWDDDANIVFNEGIRGLDGTHVEWMFTTFHGGHYQPLAWLSLAVDHAVWGLNPFGFHLTNLLLHCLASVLFFDVALMLLLRGFKSDEPSDHRLLQRAAMVAALLFAIHPLRVESVSWVTERRDVLSGVFVMLTVLGYLKFAASSRGYGWLVFSWIAFGLTLMTKASAVPLPLVLLAIDEFPLRRLGTSMSILTSRLAEKTPYISCSIAASVLAIKAQAAAEAWQPIARFDLISRLATFFYGICWYPMKFLVPTKLCALYPIPERAQLLGWTFVLSATVAVGGAIAVLVLRRKFPALLIAAIAYALLLGPVSGVAQSGEQFVADRYGYLPLLPIAILAAAALHRVVRKAKREPSRETFAKLARVSMAAYLVGLFFLTMAQATVWRDSQSLWAHALRVGVESHIAHVNVAESLRTMGRHEDAYDHYGRASVLNPADAKAFNGLGISALKIGRPDQALQHLKQAIELAPTHAKYQYNIAEVYAGYGRLNDAVTHYQLAIDAAPCFVVAIARLAAVQEANARFAGAKETLENGLKCSSGNAELSGHLAWLLATCPDNSIRDGKRAVEVALSLCDKTAYNDPMALSTLATAYAETKAYEQAIATQSEAIQLATKQGLSGSLGELRRRNALFVEHKKYRPPLAETRNRP
ncbi:MAG: O-GlcNAc transferase [Phycisphaerae bacterium]|nr:MAG: O-GlcNAc transferase [Phycisphaerae bacterium]